MTPERFRRLTEAYGALPDHWPAAERAAAEALLARGDPDALAALDEARALDVYLTMHAVVEPDGSLVRRVVASAPSSRRAGRPAWQQPRWWLSGAGIVGVGVAGIAAGVVALSLIVPAARPVGPPTAFDQTDADTAFGNVTFDLNEK
jgi:hypothetical protein